MKLKEFKQLILKAEKFAKKTDPDIFFVCSNKEFDVKNIGQFTIIPDVYVYLTKRCLASDKQKETK